MLHFMLDAYDTIEENSNNLMSVNECLVKVADTLNLQPVMPPYLVPYYYSSTFEDGGISAFMFFEGGHITLHTFPYRACYFADVMANDFFSISDAKNELLNIFNAKTVRTSSLDRRMLEQTASVVPDPKVDFGPHYMITVRDIDMTLDSISRWLDELPPKINMDAITRPYVIYSTVNNPQYISGILIVAQSHVAVHYNIADRSAYIDIFSCSFLKNEQIEKVLQESFGNKFIHRLFVRGSKYEYSYKNTSVRSEMFKRWQKGKE